MTVTLRVVAQDPAIGAADLTGEACLVAQLIVRPCVKPVGPRPDQASRIDFGPTERSRRSSSDFTTPSVAPLSRRPRVPIHISQVPRG